MSSLALVLARLLWVGGALAQPSASAHAFDYAPAPGLLYIPVEEVTLVPSVDCPIAQGGANNSGLFCSFLVTQETTFPPIASIDAVVAGVTAALQPYGVVVTTVRPPAFVPFHMVVPTDDVQMAVSSYTCTLAPTNCDGPSRNEIGFTFAQTSNCVDPDPVQATLAAFGRMSGLEGTSDPADAMDFQPDFMPPAQSFADACSAMPETPLCVAAIHESYCPGMMDVQNSHEELLGVYGSAPALPDTTPPAIDALDVPDEGANLASGAQLSVSATLSDDSGVAFLRWTVQSDAIIGLPGVADDGTISKCTNDACVASYDGVPYYAIDQPFVFDELVGLPDGDYSLSLEVQDLAGNAAASVMRTFTVGRVATDESGGETSGQGESSDGGSTGTTGSSGPDATSVTNTGGSSGSGATMGADAGSSEGESGGSGDVDEGDKGCACRTTAGRGRFGLVAMLALFAARRRRHAARAPRWNLRASIRTSG
jgi:MYXO-CTERM domain-containing protein